MLHYPLLQLRRITSSGRFVPEIDGLRFIAIASVVLYHFHGWVLLEGAVPAAYDSTRALAEHGYRGVNLFYVISGFILGLPFAAHHLTGKPAVPLKSYFVRRLTRLEPPYILNLLICFVFLLLAGGTSSRALLPNLGASLLYLHNLLYGVQSAINPVAWSLEVEVQFYCLVPLLAFIFAVRNKLARRGALAAIILLAGISQRLCWDAAPRAKLSILFAFQFFLTGLLLADIYVADWNERPSPQWPWDLVSLACWPPIFLLEDLTVWIYLPFLMLAVYVAAFRGVVFNRIFRNQAITIVGGMCYTIYLFHYSLIRPVLRITRGIRIGSSFNAYLAVQLLLYAAVLAVVSCLYFVLVERPCMARDWPRRAFSYFRRPASVRPR
ncbi:MAG TPA: acyltransferase [Bryobacteraceae bacterium]